MGAETERNKIAASKIAAAPVSLSARLRRPGRGPYVLALVAPLATLVLRLLADPWLGKVRVVFSLVLPHSHGKY